MQTVVDAATFSGAPLQLLVALAASAAAYLATCMLLGVRELAFLRPFAPRHRAPAGSAGETDE